MKQIKRDKRILLFQLEEDESVDLILRNRRTGEKRPLRTWFMPALLKFEALKVWHELGGVT